MFSPELLLAGLGLGAAYALAALVLPINAVGAVNFAQGDFVMAGGYVAVVATALLPPSLAPGLLALPLVLVAMAVLGLLFSASPIRCAASRRSRCSSALSPSA